MGIKLSSKGEVAEYVDVSQFEPGESTYECGFFQVFLNKSAGQPGKSPLHSGEWIDQSADAAYTLYDGLNNTSNKLGMNPFQLWHLLATSNVNFRWLKEVDKSLIREWIQKVGAAVIVTVDEASVYDLDLGGKVPYAWKPTGTHIITISGVRSDGNFLCRDTASIAPNGVRPGPRPYDADRLSISLSTAVLYPWLPEVPQGYDPRRDASIYPVKHTYSVVHGDTLWGIASEHGISLAKLYNENAETLDSTARFHGHANSQEGKYLYPGTLLEW